MKRNFLISFLLLMIFISISIYVVILAQGTRLDDGSIVNTSILRINSIPEDVVVYVNDKLVTKRENRVEWLEPGEAKVTLKKEGYIQWEKVVNLKAGLVEDVFAQLYPERVDFDKVTSSNIDKFFFSNNTDYIFYTVLNGNNSEDNGLWRLKLSKNILDIGDNVPNKIYNFLQSEIDDLKNSDYDIKISKDNTRLGLDIKNLKKILVFDINNPNTFIDVTNVVNFYPTKFEWFEGSNSLLLTNGSLLTQFDIASQQSTLIFFSANGEIKYTSSDAIVYYYNENKNEIFRYQGKSSTNLLMPTLFTYPDEISELYTPKDVSQILYIKSSNSLTFLDLEKKYTTIIPEVKEVHKVAPNGRGVVFSDGFQTKVLSIKDSVDFKSYVPEVFNLKMDSESLANLQYSPSSKNLLGVMDDPVEGKVVWLMDHDGLNKVDLIKNERIHNSDVRMVNNNIDIFLILQDPSAINPGTFVNNIYRFKLETTK